MPRGNVPRQPSRSGRQEAVRRVKGAADKVSQISKTERSRTPPKVGKTPKSAMLKNKSMRGYDPLAPERVRQIIADLDQLYPKATCAPAT